MTTKTDVRKLFESKYLGAWDIPEGKSPILVIDHCEGGIVEGENGRKDKCPLLFFRNVSNPAKPMVLNKTNTKAIVGLYGPYIEAWPGQAVYVYATKTNLKGEERDCIRIKPIQPPAQKASGAPVHQDAATREAGDVDGEA